MSTRDKIPTIAIVGRPNVGKSSLFNRIVGRRNAIVDKFPGITRDRLYAICHWRNRQFRLIDTGGMDFSKDNRIALLIKKQIECAMEEAQVLVFVCDITSGITALDDQIATILRRTGKKVVLLVNKIDNAKMIDAALDFYQLGLGKPYPASSMTSLGMADILDELVESIKDAPAAENSAKSNKIKVAICGKPNVGKSSFVNALLNEDRLIVDDLPGTTRDVIDISFSRNDVEYTLLDTAGIRHQKKFKESVDFFSSFKAKNAIKNADAGAVLVDGFEGLRSEDLKIVDLLITQSKPFVIAINKWDLVKGITKDEYLKVFYRRAKFLFNYPVVFISCIERHGILHVIDEVKTVFDNSLKQIPTPRLNSFLEEFKRNCPPNMRTQSAGLMYITQTSIKPLSFLIFTANPKNLSRDFEHFLTRLLSERFDLCGVEISVLFRNKRDQK